MTNSLIGRLTECCLIHWLIDNWIDWLINRLDDRFADRLAGWLNDWLMIVLLKYLTAELHFFRHTCKFLEVRYIPFRYLASRGLPSGRRKQSVAPGKHWWPGCRCTAVLLASLGWWGSRRCWCRSSRPQKPCNHKTSMSGQGSSQRYGSHVRGKDR